MTEPLISLQSVQLALNSRAGLVSILNDVTLEIAEGESLAIVGPSGSGKTSLLMIFAGLERATSGTVRFAGSDFGCLSEDDLARIRGQRIGIVFQSFHLVPTLTALENVALPLEFASRGDAVETAQLRLQEVGLSHRLSHYPAQLSGGEQQRVAIARALSTEPQLLLADEPTGNLDTRTGQDIIDLIFKLKKDHASTLVLVTHDETLAMKCHRRIHMADGRIVQDLRVGASTV